MAERVSLEWLESPGCYAPIARSAAPVGEARTLAQVYRHFGELDAAEISPLYERAVSGGVGGAPAKPTLGDRRASGHSIIGLAMFDRSALRAEAIVRCWSQGRYLAWLADSWRPVSARELRERDLDYRAIR